MIIAITGSTGDLCSLVAKELAKQGHDLIFVDRNEEKSKKNAAQIKAAYLKSKMAKADKSVFRVDESAFGQPEQTPPPPQNNKPIGFESVLKNKKRD